MNTTHMHTSVSDPTAWANAVTQQIAVTVTPLDPTKCYFIVIRDNDRILSQWEAAKLRDLLNVNGIKGIVVQLPDSVEIECIEQEAPQGQE